MLSAVPRRQFWLCQATADIGNLGLGATTTKTNSSLSRLGGEMPLFSDRFGREQPWAANWLAFSHGRAAMAWLIGRQRAKTALVCAYTCPSVPAFLRRAGIAPVFYDVGADAKQIAASAKRLKAPTLVLVPALFGSPPWLDTDILSAALGRRATVMIDAAQTAFGHQNFPPPPQGATLSCPRKTTSLSDGAVLALGRGLSVKRHIVGPAATEAIAWKIAARALWATGRQDLELQAVRANKISEEMWPGEPRPMSDESRTLLARLDERWHRTKRRANRQVLGKMLDGYVPVWAPDSGTPFSLPVFVHDTDALVRALMKQRIFASRLWPHSEHRAIEHPAAAYMTRHLVSLPIDQRHSEDDMAQIASAVLRTARPPRGKIPDLLRTMIRL